MKLYNTASKSIEDFQPLLGKAVTFYSCGPTVYDYTHIGHVRTYINNDVLKRALEYLGFTVNHVMNITDVGHLTGDDDTGEDKLEKGAVKSGKSVWDIVKLYTDHFKTTMKSVNVLDPTKTAPATDHIPQMIALIKRLEEKRYTYETSEAIYFDTAKFKNYGLLSGQKLEDKIQQAREEVHIDKDKKNKADFALWFKRVGRFEKHTMHWDSPWGKGFPGWHIECSAMAMHYLGDTIDVHSGGIDHIPVHHENEIAQSEASTGKTFVNYWFHNAFLMVENAKMSKSLGNFYTIEDVTKRRIDPLSLRLLFLQSHYRQTANFTWEAAEAAQKSLLKLREQVQSLMGQSDRPELSPEKMSQIEQFQNSFRMALENDLNMPQALAVFWSMLKSNIPPPDKLDLALSFDEVLGLGLNTLSTVKPAPQDIARLANKREEARRAKNFAESDRLRSEIENRGYTIKDTTTGYILTKSQSHNSQ
jgi:cysteinyl-tRNA synthetase